MSTAVLDKNTITSSFTQVLQSLSEKERGVIERRVGLEGHKETLQSIGDSFQPSITRERVRQIEESGIKKIGRIIKASVLADIQAQAHGFLEAHGGVLVKSKLINAIIKDLSLSSDMNSAIIELIIQSDYAISKSKPKLGTQTYFTLPEAKKKTIEAVHKDTLKILKKRKDVMDQQELYSLVAGNLEAEHGELGNVFMDSCLDIFEDLVKGEETLIGLSKWKILNPKTLKDKAIYVMKKEKVPMHFIDISNQITAYLGEQVKVNTIHNELIRNNEFVLIGRGIYALKEWGFKPGTVIDVITDVLQQNGGAMNTEEIVKQVLKTRNVKNTTIYMNLQNKKIIERVGRNYYQLKTA
jgi:DNA-directed RNA polymerase delta subunit